MGNINADNDNRKARSKSNYEKIKMPKNLRQVGSIEDVDEVIYVEDYVMSYMKQLSEKNQNESKIAILVGKYIYNEEGKNVFINGAIEMEDINTNEKCVFADESWTNIYEKIKEYFIDVEIIGWAIIGFTMFHNSEEKIKNIHQENFRGKDKVLLQFDCMEKEENFYIVKNNQSIRQNGYYIYYEKNEDMQNYMIDHNQREANKEVYDDVATKKIRNVIEKKQTNKSEKEIKQLLYAAGTLIAIIVLVVGSSMLRNYHQMKNLETVLQSLTEKLEAPEDKEVIKQGSPNNNQSSGDGPGDGVQETEESQNTEETQAPQGEAPSVSDHESPGDGTNPSTGVETVPGNVSQTEEEPTEEETTGPVIIEEPSELPTEEEPEVAPTINEVKYYIVRSGDTIVSICNELYKTSSQKKINEIIALNDIGDMGKIYPGQQLIVP